jgi:hypothetical protein
MDGIIDQEKSIKKNLDTPQYLEYQMHPNSSRYTFILTFKVHKQGGTTMKGGKNGKAHHLKKLGPFAFLSCEVSDGMFRGEKIVSLRIADNDISVIVNANRLTGNKLKVDVLDKRGKDCLIGLPGESFSTSRQLWISQDLLNA